MNVRAAGAAFSSAGAPDRSCSAANPAQRCNHCCIGAFDDYSVIQERPYHEVEQQGIVPGTVANR